MTNENAREDSGTKAKTAPHPDDERKPQTPAELIKPSWMYIARKTMREFTKDHCQDLAAGLVYYGVLSIFPALLALVSLLGIFGEAEKTTDALLNFAGKFVPSDSLDLIKGPINQLTHSSAAGFTLIIGILAALWSASGYVRAFGRALNRVYEVDEGRPGWKLRASMLLVTLAVVVLLGLSASLLALSGPVAEAVGNAVGLGGPAVTIWNIAKWPVLLILIILAIAILYYATPNVKQPKFRWMSIGSAIALVIFILASVGFAFYVANFSHYNKTYGTLGGAIVMLLWFWILNISLLFGAEFDAEVERGRELQAGIEAEKTIQLPPRGTAASEKKEEQERVDELRGRALRFRAERAKRRADRKE